MLVNWSWIGEQVGHDLTGESARRPTSCFRPSPRRPRRRSRRRRPGALARAIPPPVNSLYFDMARKCDIKLGNFVQIARLSLTLVFALVGGVVGRAFAARTEAAHRRSADQAARGLG